MVGGKAETWLKQSGLTELQRFLYLGRSFNYSSKVLSLAVKVVVNQIVFTPVFNSYFFGMQALLSGDSIISAWEHIKHTVPVSFVNACKLWPAVTAFNFTYIDPQYRALFAGRPPMLVNDYPRLLLLRLRCYWLAILSIMAQPKSCGRSTCKSRSPKRSESRVDKAERYTLGGG